MKATPMNSLSNALKTSRAGRSASLAIAVMAIATLAVSLPASRAEATVLYQQNFNTYPSSSTISGTTLHNRDNWVGSGDSPLGASVTSAISGGGFSGNSVSFGGAARRPNSVVIPDGAKISMEYDIRGGGSSTMWALVGLATTDFTGTGAQASQQPAFQFGNNGGALGWRVRRSGDGASVTTSNTVVGADNTPLFDPSGVFYWRIKLEVDFAAFGGNGSASLYVMDMDPNDGVSGPSSYTAVPGMQNYNLNFVANNITAANVTQIFVRTSGDSGIDNIVVTLIPEPSAFALLGAGMLGCFALRRRRR